MPPGPTAITVEIITSFDGMHVADVQCIAPDDPADSESGGGIKLKMGKAKGALRTAAMSGFKTLNTRQLRTLAVDWGLEVPRVKRVDVDTALATLLIRHSLGDACTDDVLKSALSTRAAPEEAHKEFELAKSLSTLPVGANDDDDEDEDASPEEDEIALQAWETLRLQRVAARERAVRDASHAMAECDRVETELEEAASSSAEGRHPATAAERAVPAGSGRKFNPIACKAWSAEDARKLLPPAGFSLTKDLRENRWRLHSKLVLEGQSSKSYGRNSMEDDYAALLFLLRLAWKAWCRDNGGICPHDLSGSAGAGV